MSILAMAVYHILFAIFNSYKMHVCTFNAFILHVRVIGVDLARKRIQSLLLIFDNFHHFEKHRIDLERTDAQTEKESKKSSTEKEKLQR